MRTLVEAQERLARFEARLERELVNPIDNYAKTYFKMKITREKKLIAKLTGESTTAKYDSKGKYYNFDIKTPEVKEVPERVIFRELKGEELAKWTRIVNNHLAQKKEGK